MLELLARRQFRAAGKEGIKLRVWSLGATHAVAQLFVATVQQRVAATGQGVAGVEACQVWLPYETIS